MALRLRTLWPVGLTAAAVAVLLWLIGGEGPPTASAAAPGTKTVTVLLSDEVFDANPAAPGWGRVTSTPAGIDCPAVCTADFPRGSTVVLRVTPVAGHELASWAVFDNEPGPDCDRPAATCTLLVGDDDRVAQVQAALRPEVQLLATPEGAGTLTITPSEAGRAPLPCTIQVPQYDRLPDACTPRYRKGTLVTVRALADPAVPGARLTRWSDYRCKSNTTCRVRLNSDHHLTAFFSPAYLTLVPGSFGPVAMPPPGGLCTFEPDPLTGEIVCQVLYSLKTRVTLRRDPALAQVPTDEWTGSCRGIGAECTFTMRRNELVRAGTERGFDIPARVRETLRLELTGKGKVSFSTRFGQGQAKPCTKTCVRPGYQHGDEVVLTASPKQRFVRWADGYTAKQRTRTVVIGDFNPVRAVFKKK